MATPTLRVPFRPLTAHPSRALPYLPLAAMAVDVALVLVALGASVLGRNTVFDLDGQGTGRPPEALVPLVVLGWLLLIAFQGAYRTDVFGAGTDEYKRVINASMLMAGAVGIGSYLVDWQVSRGLFLVLFLAGPALLVVGRFSLRRVLREAYRRDLLRHRVIISGSPAHVDEIAAALRREVSLGYQVVGALTPAVGDATTPSGIPVLGRSSAAALVVHEHDADVIFFADNSLGTGHEMRMTLYDLESHRVRVVVAPSVADIAQNRVQIRPVGGLPLMHIEKPRHDEAVRWAKRSFDVVGSLALLVLFAPLMLLATIQVRRHDGGSTLFRHARIGRDGQEFSCLKFRTMVPDAEHLLTALLEDTGSDGLLFKAKDDPRITRPGRWLRRFSVDELPQLINVLRGDMSLVGPRPQVAREVALYEGSMSRRLLVRPGLTGLWQVSGRSDLSVEQAMELDVHYVDNWSMVQDLWILLRTLGAVVRSRGAY